MIEKNTVTAKQKNKKDQNLFAISMVCLGYFAFSILDAASKYLLQDGIPLAQAIGIINIIVTIFFLVFILSKSGISGLKVKQKRLHLIRVLSLLAIPYLILKSLTILSLSEFYPIVFLSPLTIIIASILFLGEPPEKTKIIMTFIGLIGVLVVVQGQLSQQWLGFVLVLGAVLLGTINTIIIRKIANNTPDHDRSKYTLSLYPSIATAIVYTPFALEGYVEPTGIQWGILTISAIALCVGQLGFVIGFSKASSTTTVAPYHYTQMIWGIILGFLIFENVPSISTLIGALLIIYSGLYIVLFTRDKAKQT